MIILDFNQLMIATFVQSLSVGGQGRLVLQEDIVRHMVLNTIRSIITKNKSKYGKNIYVASDSNNCWRKQIFPYYKASRKKDREKSSIDWSKLFEYLNKIRDEIKENFPYSVINVPNTEADDIIAYLCNQKGVHKSDHEHGLNAGDEEKILIVSGDKDFIQLQAMSNVEQYSPITKKMLVTDNANAYLIEHIVNGDKDDGVPNILSDSDTFVNPQKRQKPVRREFLDSVIENINQGKSPSEFLKKEIHDNWVRNDNLINLKKVPTHINLRIQEEVYSESKKVINKDQTLYKYFSQHRLRSLLEKMGEF